MSAANVIAIPHFRSIQHIHPSDSWCTMPLIVDLEGGGHPAVVSEEISLAGRRISLQTPNSENSGQVDYAGG